MGHNNCWLLTGFHSRSARGKLSGLSVSTERANPSPSFGKVYVNEMDVVEAICDSVIIIHKGKIVADELMAGQSGKKLEEKFRELTGDDR